ncbi:cell division protein ZapE, partial [Kineococcus glutinatus]|uniref:cell division protein ZapE n=1 Tax=Kineococcus glutinatus TaxID=1070872 RepID=UPI0031EE77C0
MRARHRAEVARVRAAFDREAAARGFRLEAAQQRAADRLAVLAADLATGRPARGAYLVGPVGRGKSFLLGVLAQEVPGARRVHLHSCLRELNAAVHAHRGSRTAVADALADLLAGCRLLCFDEVAVHDPGDAALLTRLLRELGARGAALAATSNSPVADLLPDPQFHHLFLPGIALLGELVEEVAVAGPVDHRGAPVGRRSGFAAG